MRNIVPRPLHVFSAESVVNVNRELGEKAAVLETSEMLRLFQVNEGRFVDSEGELTPNSK